jgi:hypothetical protein
MACDFASFTSIVSNWRYFQPGKWRNIVGGQVRQVRWVEDDNHVLGKKFPGEEGSMRQCVIMMKHQVLLSPKFRMKSLHIFTQSP